VAVLDVKFFEYGGSTDETRDLPWRMLNQYHELPSSMIPSVFPCEMIGLK
jgi:hypothetical protein